MGSLSGLLAERAGHQGIETLGTCQPAPGGRGQEVPDAGDGVVAPLPILAVRLCSTRCGTTSGKMDPWGQEDGIGRRI